MHCHVMHCHVVYGHVMHCHVVHDHVVHGHEYAAKFNHEVINYFDKKNGSSINIA